MQKKGKYPNTPIFVFAHSFGSFVGQEYITRYGEKIDGIIICGSAAQVGIMFKIAKVLASIQIKLHGEETEGKFLEKLSFCTYNKGIDTSDNTNWLSHDPVEVKKYKDDPKCGFTCTNGFYYYFSDALVNLYKKEKLKNIPKALPIYVIAGQEDPVGQYGKNVEKLYDIYKDLSMSDLNIKLYKDCRHELSNELNRDEITEDILKWLKDHKVNYG